MVSLYDVNNHDWVSNMTFMKSEFNNNINTFTIVNPSQNSSLIEIMNIEENTRVTTTIRFESTTFTEIQISCLFKKIWVLITVQFHRFKTI